MKRLSILVVFLFLASVYCSTPFTDYTSPGTGITVLDLWIFPNPITVHTVAHILFSLKIDTNVTHNLTLDYAVVFQTDTVASISGVDLCSINATAHLCQLSSASNLEISFDYPVPRIPRGNYTFSFIARDETGFPRVSIAFNLTVIDPPTASSCTFTSQFQATLEGNLLEEQPNGFSWSVGNQIQIGTIGPIPQPDIMQFVYGDFLDFSGSEDFLYAWMPLAGDIATEHYIWGLYGNITNHTSHGNTQTSIIQGNFHVGYYDPLAPVSYGFSTEDTAIVKGTFVMNVYYDRSLGQPIINGTLNSSRSEQPNGWPYPTTFGRLNLTFSSTSEGEFVVQGSRTYCLCDPLQCNPPFNPATGSSNLVNPPAAAVTHLQAGFIAAAAILAAALLALALICLLVRRKRNYHEGDGVFDITRKPEYGTVLVVDDIVQETRRRESEANLLGGVGRIGRDVNIPSNSESPSQYSSSPISRSNSEDVSRSETDSHRGRDQSNSRTDSYTRSYSEDVSRSESDSQRGRRAGASYSGSSSPRSDSRSRSISRTQSKSSYTGTETETRDSRSPSVSPSESERSRSPSLVRNTPPGRRNNNNNDPASSSAASSRTVSRTNSESSVGSRSVTSRSRSRSDLSHSHSQSQSQSQSQSDSDLSRTETSNRGRSASHTDRSEENTQTPTSYTESESE